MQTRSTLSRKAATGILVALSLYIPAALAAERSFDRTLSVNGPVTLHVSTGSGYVHVSAGADNQVHIVGHVKSNNSWWGGSSDDAVAQVASNPPINQAGNIISVGDDHGDWARHVTIDYEIMTPTNTMLVAESGGAAEPIGEGAADEPPAARDAGPFHPFSTPTPRPLTLRA